MIKKYMLLAFVSLVLLASCGGSRPSPKEVIAGAIDAVNELQTYRFEMTGTMTLEGKNSHGNMQGEFVSPDRLHMITISDGETQEGIRIGQTEYYRVPGSDSWEVREWPSAMASARNNWAVSTVEILDTLVGLVKLRDEKIDGVSCFHYRGNVDIEAQVEEQIANLDPSQPYYEEMVMSIEQQLQSENDVEFWVGKEDYLLRRLDTHYEMTYTEDEGEDTESEEHVIANYSFRFFDFNQPIQIEPPIADTTGGVDLYVIGVGSGAGCEDQHCQVDFDVTITNQGIATARNVRVFIDSQATSQGLQTMEALPDQRPADLGPDESATFLVSWEANLDGFSDEEFHALVQQYVIHATWVDGDGQQHEKTLRETDETGAIIE